MERRGPDDLQSGAETLLAKVRTAFPALVASSARIDDSGGDHILLIIDEQLAFRFPRTGMHDLALEMKTLRRLQAYRTPATPIYEHIDPQGHFAGYRLIAGSPLTSERFAQLSSMKKQPVLAQLASFLDVLHGLDPQSVAALSVWPIAWSSREYAVRIIDERLPAFWDVLPDLAASIASFLDVYRLDQSSELAVVHGDFVTDHILLDDSGNGDIGIIDFGDVGLGDPALDVAGCWAYGSDAVRELIRSYAHSDPGMLSRSRNHFIRYCIDRLFELFTEAAPRAQIEEQSTKLAMLLDETSR